MAEIAKHIGAVARRLLGEPNRDLSSAAELRFGTNGSLAVDLGKGTWFSHEEGKGGDAGGAGARCVILFLASGKPGDGHGERGDLAILRQEVDALDIRR